MDEGPIREALAFVDSRKDCVDFTIAGLLRIIYRYDQSPNIATGLIADIETCLLGFKYWWDEPGDNRRCYHTENHQILFHSDELLLGQRLRDRPFTNDGRNGRAHMAHGLRLTRRWLDHRARFGYSEWLSNCYFEEDLLALLNLYDFAEDEGVRRQAKAQIDVLLFEMALHTYRGIFGATAMRTYPRLIKGARRGNSLDDQTHLRDGPLQRSKCPRGRLSCCELLSLSTYPSEDCGRSGPPHGVPGSATASIWRMPRLLAFCL